MLSAIPINALEQGLVKSYHDQKTHEINYLASIFVVYLPFAVLLSMLWAIFKSPEGLLVLFIFIWASISKNLLTLLLTHQNRYKVAIFLKALDPVARAFFFGIASIYFLGSQHLMLDSAKFSYTFASLAIVTLALLAFDRKIFSIKDFFIGDFLSLFKFGLKFSYPLMIWSLFGFAIMYSPMWVFDVTGLSESVSLFNVFYFISALGPSMLVTFFSISYIPKYYSGEIRSIKPIVKSYCALVLLGGVVLYFSSYYVVSYISSEIYAEKNDLIIIFYMANSAFYLAQLVNFRFFKENKTLELLAPNVVSGIAAVVMACIGIKFFGEIGGIFSFLISNFIYLALTLMKCRAQFGRLSLCTASS